MPPGWADAVKGVRRHGERNGFPLLVEPRWPAEESQARDMAAIANHLLNGKGVYRFPDGDDLLLLVMTDVRPARP